MSLNPLAEAGRRRRDPLAGWPLRTRLIAAMVALLAVVCLVISVVTLLTLRHTLMGKLDNQVVDVSKRAPAGGGPRGGYEPGDQECSLSFLGGGNDPGTLGACITGSTVVARTVGQGAGPEAPQTDVPASALAALAAVPEGNDCYTQDLGDLGSYRLVARSVNNGQQRLVVGLPLDKVNDTLWTVAAVEIVVAIAGLMTAAAASAVIVRITLRPLRRVAATAARVTELPLDRGEVALSVRVPEPDTDPRTEVGQVGAALNRLLGHVAHALNARQASETRVRQFVADASHELRTPLAAIRGYAELTRRGHDTVSPDVAHAMSRVESESARMTSLVDDLLLLARIDSGRPLERAPVDLSRLVVDAVSDAHVAGPDHRWTLDLPEESVTVPGDSARLHQVLVNLLANARTHTPPGTTVTTKLGVADRHVTMQVVDNGPGIPSELLPEVFERFARGDSSRSRAAGSTGLGLAIVAAVVEAHQGHVEVASKPGWTAFTVHLPLA